MLCVLNLICDFYRYIYKYKKNDEPKLKYAGNISKALRCRDWFFYSTIIRNLGWVRELLTLNKLFLLLQ